MDIDSNTVTVYNKSMQEHKSHLTIEELAERVDMSVRTIRYYIAEGLLPGPEGRGKATAYGEEHVQRLRLIRLLSNQHMPLAEMSQLLNRLSLIEVQALLAEEEQHAKEGEQAGRQPAPQEYIAGLLKNARVIREVVPPAAPTYAKKSYSQPAASAGETWTRWELLPGLELHVKVSVEERHSYLIERIFKIVGIPYPRSQK